MDRGLEAALSHNETNLSSVPSDSRIRFTEKDLTQKILTDLRAPIEQRLDDHRIGLEKEWRSKLDEKDKSILELHKSLDHKRNSVMSYKSGFDDLNSEIAELRKMLRESERQAETKMREAEARQKEAEAGLKRAESQAAKKDCVVNVAKKAVAASAKLDLLELSGTLEELKVAVERL